MDIFSAKQHSSGGALAAKGICSRGKICTALGTSRYKVLCCMFGVTYGCSWERNLLAVPSDGIGACFNDLTAPSSPSRLQSQSKGQAIAVTHLLAVGEGWGTELFSQSNRMQKDQTLLILVSDFGDNPIVAGEYPWQLSPGS